MRALVILLVGIIVQVNGDCLKLEDCLQNVTNTFLVFGEYYSNIMFRARDYIKATIPKFKIHYREYNATVLSGPKRCQRRFLLKKKMGYYLRDAMNMCVVPQPDPNQEDVENIKDLNQSASNVGKEKFCKHLVAYFNIYCKYLDEVMVTADNCDVEKNFDLLFTSKWKECADKARRFRKKSRTTVVNK